MRNVATFAAFAAGANALVPRDNTCCFHITASGEASGQVGQLGDGQNRIGGDLPPGQFCIDADGSITDGSGRGCILTPPTTQFQCDLGATPTPGFSVSPNGQLEYNGQTSFVACQTGENNELNIYTQPGSADVTGCVSVQLTADGCSGSGSGSSSSSVPVSPSSSAPVPSSTVPVASPSPSGPGSQAPGQGTSTVPVISPGPSGPGSEGPGQGTGTVPVVSPSPSGPGGGEGPGPSGPGQGATTIPVVSPAPSGPGSEGPGGGGGGGGVPPSTCAACPATATVYTTITVDCSSGTPGVPGGGETPTGPSGGGVTPTGPSGGGETPTGPSGGGVTPTGPSGGGETPTGPSGGGETPTGPGGGGVTPTGPSGGGETPTGPSGGGVTPTGPGGGGETPTGPGGGGVTPTGPPGGGETPTGPSGGGVTPTGPSGGGETPTGPSGGGETPTGPSGGGETPQPHPSGGNCPADLSGNYEYPHLIIPVDSSSPDSAAGTSFNGTVTSTVSTIFNFDIPASDAGKTCSLVFLFPKQEDLETSAFSFSGDGQVQFGALQSPANQGTSYNNAPAVSSDYGKFTIFPGNSYVINTVECPAGQTVSFEMTNAGNTNFDFFEDYNPSPLGLYVTVC